ncbi:MAG: hypothetical protein AAFO96_27545 [Bacteroidota bacterium]
MNPTVKFTFPDGLPPVNKALKKLKEKAGLAFQHTAHHFEGVHRIYIDGRLVDVSDFPIIEHIIIFRIHYFKLKFDEIEQKILFDVDPLGVGYLHGCLIEILEELGGSAYPVGTIAPEYVNLPYEKAILDKRFKL